MSGTALPKLRISLDSGDSKLVSFKWLKDERMLREGSRPKCKVTKEIVPNFMEENVDHITHEAVFLQEQSYYRPSVYCVDGRRYEEEERAGLQPSYIILLTCQDRAEERRWCGEGERECPRRCCQPWQSWIAQSRQCVYTKSKHSNRYRQVTRMMITWCRQWVPPPLSGPRLTNTFSQASRNPSCSDVPSHEDINKWREGREDSHWPGRRSNCDEQEDRGRRRGEDEDGGSRLSWPPGHQKLLTDLSWVRPAAGRNNRDQPLLHPQRDSLVLQHSHHQVLSHTLTSPDTLLPRLPLTQQENGTEVPADVNGVPLLGFDNHFLLLLTFTILCLKIMEDI